MDLMWLPAAVGNSILSGAQAEINRRYKQEPFRMNMWRTFLAALFWMPFALIQPWPTDTMFYSAAAFCGFSMVIGNNIMNELSARHNGRVAVLHMPVKAFIVLVAWAFITPSEWYHLTHEDLWQQAAALMFFGIMVAAMNAMRSNDASWGALKALVPVIFIYAASDIAARLVLTPTNLTSLLIVYMFIASSVSAVFSLMMIPWRPKPDLPLADRNLVEAGGLAALITVMNHTCFFIGLALAPNPAYVSMVALLAPAWLFVYHRVFNIPDHASPWASMVLVMGSIGLLIVLQ